METLKETNNILKEEGTINGYEISRVYNEILKGLRKKYHGNVLYSMKVRSFNRNEINIIRKINDYINNTIYVSVVIMVIIKYYEMYIEKYYHEYEKYIILKHDMNTLYKIRSSVYSQRNITSLHKDIFMRVPFDENKRRAIMYSLNICVEHLNMIMNNILPEYIQSTPLYEYEIYLREEGRSIIDEIVDLYNNADDINNVADNYIKDIDAIVMGYSKWEEHLEGRFTILNVRYNDYRNMVMANKQKEIESNCEVLRDKLINMVAELRRKYDNTIDDAFGYSNIAIINKKDAAVDFKIKNGCRGCKIFVILINRSNAINREVKFYTKDIVGKYIHYSKYIGKATIYDIDAPLPDYLKEMVDNHKWVYMEFIL